MVRFLESNGYDVSYTTGVDTDRRGAELLEHEVFLSVGHDEYWSGAAARQRRGGPRRRRAPGVLQRQRGLLEDPLGEQHRRVRHAVPHAGHLQGDPRQRQDRPAGPPMWTGTWRDPRFSPPGDGGRPENALTGQIFTMNCCAINMVVGSADGKMRFWRNTRVATLAGNATTTVGTNIIGYEWDEDLDNGFRPAGAFRVSADRGHRRPDHRTTASNYASGAGHALDDDVPGTQRCAGLRRRHDPVGVGPRQQPRPRLRGRRRRRPAGDGQPARRHGRAADDAAARAWSRPTASTDTVAPTSTITAPADGATVPVGQPADRHRHGGRHRRRPGRRGRGLDRQRRHLAPGHRTRVVDLHLHARRPRARSRSGPGPPTTAPTSRRPAPASRSRSAPRPRACPCTIWPGTATPAATDPDTSSVELGVKFRAGDQRLHHRDPVLQAGHVHRHPRRHPVDRHRHQARHRHVHQRDRQRLAAGQLRRRRSRSPPNTTYVASYFTPSRYAVSGGLLRDRGRPSAAP